MDDLAFLRERIESYADYTNDAGRRLTDEQIRAYVGEALSRLIERLQPVDDASHVLATLVFRCQFADQLIIRALDADTIAPVEILAIHAADRVLVSLADRADGLAVSELTDFLAQIKAALDRRSAVILNPPPADVVRPPR